MLVWWTKQASYPCFNVYLTLSPMKDKNCYFLYHSSISIVNDKIVLKSFIQRDIKLYKLRYTVEPIIQSLPACKTSRSGYDRSVLSLSSPSRT